MKTSQDGTYNKGFGEIAMLALCAVGILIAGVFLNNLEYKAPKAPVAGSVNTVGGIPYYLYGSGVGSSDVSITLTFFKIPVSNQKLQMSDFGTIGYLTLEPGNTTKQEFVSFAGITQNADGTATLTGVSRGLSPITPYTASSTLQKAHAGGTQAAISNPPQLYQNFLTLSNDATSTAVLTFSSTTPPRMDNVRAQAQGTYNATTSEFATYALVAAVANAGTVNATEAVKGIAELGTAFEQASSTVFGGTSAGLVMQTKNATDSPTVGCASGYSSTAGAGCSIIALLTGKIKQAWLDLTASFTWTGAHTFNATTTIAASNASTTALVLNTLPYQISSSRGASSTVLMENGYGHLYWGKPDWFLIASTITTAASASTTLSNIPAATDLRVVVTVGKLTAPTISYQFNGDTGTTYQWSNLSDTGTATGGLGSTQSVLRVIAGVNTGTTTAQISITNVASDPKIITGQAVNDGGSGDSLWGVWTNTSSQISSITVGCQPACPSNTRIRVYGSNQ